MKFEISPIEVSDLVPFSSSLNFTYASQSCKPSFAGISKNGLWMWIVCDTTINIYHTENSEWFGGYSFSETLKSPTAKIAAVTEFCSSHISFPCLLISVNHDHESIICMYDINISKVVRAVLVPDSVVTFEVISGNGGACIDTLHLFMQLRYMFGIVAIGTSTGHLYFLDLCLDEDFLCIENSPNITLVIKKYELLPERREKAISKHQHILMLLNDQSVRNGSFEFESRSSSLGHFPYGKVHVTALKYIQSTVSLAVGFNFGGIQLWDLQDLCLLYTVANQPQELPIIAFAFQEPENDPRHFCYLWIIRGYSANERPKDFSTATMYSLIYEKRTFVESFGYLYTDLRNCTKRFEYRMTSDPFSAAQSSSSAGSCLLACQTVCQTDESHLDVFSANDSDTTTENMSLCFLSWIVWSHGESNPTSYHSALFDLNQWYRAEMPSSNLRSDPSDLNPYFAHFTLEEVAQIFDLEPLLGVYAIPHSIKKFKYITPSEEFFFPSSLDFQMLMFSINGICKTTFMGLQKRLLYEIADMGPNALVNPKEFYSDLIRSGLIADTHTANERVPLITQRETFLQLALEYHIPFFFMKCLKEWRYADSIQEGCTSRALLNWAWKKVINIKSSIDKLSIPLFNCSGCDIDKSSLKCLYNYRRQFDLIDSIFMGYQKFATPRTEQGIQELKCRKDVVFSINTYLQVILWLRSVCVLPEVCEGEESEKNMLYPVTDLFNSYLKRRSHLQKIHSSIGPTDILLIDGLVKENFSENTWPEKGGNGIYPPPSIYAALSCYLLDDVHLELKHSLMYYLLLDICNASQNVKSPLINEVKKFPLVFGMSQSTAKLVKAFWYLDQFNFEVAIKKLLHPSVKASDIQPWQHHRVIKSFLFQREARKALKYINHMEPPENTIEDMKLHLSVLLARGAIIQAFDYQRSKQYIGFGTELLNHLFLGCQEMRKLKDLMYMPLNTLESSMLIKFLSENEDPRAQEALVMYYLLRCNFFEAAKVNEKLSMNFVGKSSDNERTAGRDALVEGLLASVPKAEKNLVEEISRFPSVHIRKAEPLKPLSLAIKTAPLKQITYSDILNSLITDTSSAMCTHYSDPQTPLRSKNCFENIPFLRPPLTPEPTKISSDAIHSTPVTKRILTSPSSEFSSPTKRSRLLDNAPFRTPLSKKKIPKHLVGDVASLLQSPPIHRRSSKLLRDTSIKDSSATAPQGILKKNVVTSKFPVSDIYDSKTPSVLSDAGEDSDDDIDKDEMIIDEVHNDVPGRQIRFSVPSKENLSISAISDMDVQSPSVSGISEKPSNFKKRLEESKPTPHLEPFYSDSREYTSVARRHTLLNLTREPLKAHSQESPKKQIFTDHENPCIESTKIASTISYHVVQEKLTTESDSDSCPTLESANDVVTPYEETESKKYDSNVAFTQLDAHRSSESALNRSGSSSGNSSYNSAVSERSFIITPRKPLRDNSRNSSFSDALTFQENKSEETVSAEKTAEVEMVIDDDDENICDVSDEDVSIIGEVEASPAEATVSVQNKGCNISPSISVERKTTEQSVEEMDAQILPSSAPEIEKCDSSEDAFIFEEPSLALEQEQVFDNPSEAEVASVPVQDIEVKENIDEVVLSDKKIIEKPQINIICAEESQVDKPPEDFTTEICNFDNDVPIPSLPSYVPINERISKSQQNVSELSKFDDDGDDDEAYPSLLLQEQMDLQKQIEILESTKSNVPEDHSLSVQPLTKPSEKFQTIPESSHAMNTDSSEAETTAKSIFPSTLTETKDFSQKLSERFDFLSKNSEFYENNKLYRETMNLLKGSDIPQSFEFGAEKKSSRKTRNFVFDKGDSSTETDLKTSEATCLKPKTSDAASSTKEFLESWQPETYKQFSDSIQKGTSEDQNEALKSSPNISHEKNSVSIFKTKIETPVSEVRKKKKQESVKKGTSVDKKQRSAIKKAKEKSKTKKIEFSFAEPHSPAGPEILEALTNTPQYPVGSFMFSPPLTRGRLRQKKLDDSLGSSFASAASETSFAKAKKPPVDPILEEIMAEKAPELLEPSSKRRTKLSTKKKTPVKKTTKSEIPQLELSDSSLNASKLVEVDSPNLSTSTILSSAKPITKHGMVLRQAKEKKRTVKLF